MQKDLDARRVWEDCAAIWYPSMKNNDTVYCMVCAYIPLNGDLGFQVEVSDYLGL